MKISNNIDTKNENESSRNMINNKVYISNFNKMGNLDVIVEENSKDAKDESNQDKNEVGLNRL